MIVLYNGCHTSFDVMKEYMIYGAELDEKYQIPIVPACSLDYLPEDSIDFGESFSQKIKGHRKLNVNFYIDDSKFQRLWNNPDKYLEHLKCFHSVCMPDFSIATGDCGMPFALNLYNVYRNHALAHYMLLNGIRVIPSVGIPDKDNYDLCFAGYSKAKRMATLEKLFYSIMSGTQDRNIKFSDMQKILEVLGFQCRIKGDHFIYWRDGIDEIINIQPDGNKAKPYQVKQIRNIILKYGLEV